MERELEFHDSTIKQVTLKGQKVILALSKANIHIYEKHNNTEKHTCWLQDIDIILHGASLVAEPKHLPIWISDGFITIDGKTLEEMKLPLKAKGTIQIALVTQANEKFFAKASKLETKEIGKATYLQDFPE